MELLEKWSGYSECVDSYMQITDWQEDNVFDVVVTAAKTQVALAYCVLAIHLAHFVGHIKLFCSRSMCPCCCACCCNK